MEALVVYQVTGNHGWTAGKAYSSGLKKHDISIVECTPIAAWGELELKHCDGLFEKMETLTEKDIVIFLGFDWHSQALHKNPEYSKSIKNCKARRIGLFQEHVTAEWIEKAIGLKSDFEAAVKSAARCLTHIVCNHEQDVGYVRKITSIENVIFLPFCADIDTFKESNIAKIPKAFFRGKETLGMKNDPYTIRKKLMQSLAKLDDFIIECFDPNKFKDLESMTNAYTEDLNRYRFQLDLPSLSNSLTCRPFEIGATGSLPLSEKPHGLVSQGIFTQDHIEFVDFRKQPFDSQIICKLNSDFEKNVATKILNLKKLIINKHSHIVRVNQLLDWINEKKSDEQIYSELISKRHSSLIGIDLVFFQLAKTGIARVWTSIIKYIDNSAFADRFILLKRKNCFFDPEIVKNIRIIEIERHSYLSNDAQYLEHVCNIYQINTFITTYYSFTNTKLNCLLLHDFIPEHINPDCYSNNMWAEKKVAISKATNLFIISNNTAKDLAVFHVESARKPTFAAYNQIGPYLPSAKLGEVNRFKADLRLRDTVLLVVGERVGYLGYKNIENSLIALSQLRQENKLNANNISLLFTGGAEYGRDDQIEPRLEKHLYGFHIVRKNLAERELSAAYTCASLLLYPSLLEGYGLPPIEASYFQTPSLLINNGINRELWGAEYTMATDGSVYALKQVLQRFFNKPDMFCDELHKFTLKRRPSLESRGNRQSANILEVLLLEDGCFRNQNLQANQEQIDHWIERVNLANVSRLNSEIDYETNDYVVTAIVSVFAAARFFEGCLDDLIEQTLFLEGKMEIIIIDSNSPENEVELIRPYIERYKNIFYYKTLQRETLYSAWNRACKLARGKYITNANADDRHRLDFASCLANYLEQNKNIQLTYPQQYITFNENEHFDVHNPSRVWGWPSYSLQQLKIGNHVGSQPMWRRTVHRDIGYFESDFSCAGDYEFWLRIATMVGPLELYPVPIGTYFFNPNGIEHGDPVKSKIEMDYICDQYDIRRNYSISKDDKAAEETSDGRSFESLQYNGVALQNTVTVIVEFTNNLNVEDLLFEIEKQSLFIDHLPQIKIQSTGDAVLNKKIEKSVQMSQTRDYYIEDIIPAEGCVIKVSFDGNGRIPEDSFRTMVSKTYNENLGTYYQSLDDGMVKVTVDA